jgi:nicotinate phosphoribosyltransferase
MLDKAGFDYTVIVMSSQLDEITIWQILEQIEVEAPRYGVDADDLIGRMVYGVGTRMVTSHGDPSLDGVYKLVAVGSGGDWKPAIKLSDTSSKVVNPGRKRVWRIYDDRGKATADVLSLADEEIQPPIDLHHMAEARVHRTLSSRQVSKIEELLQGVDISRYPAGAELIEAARARRLADLERLDPGVRRLVNPHVYHVSLTAKLWNLKQELIAGAEPSNAQTVDPLND